MCIGVLCWGYFVCLSACLRFFSLCTPAVSSASPRHSGGTISLVAPLSVCVPPTAVAPRPRSRRSSFNRVQHVVETLLLVMSYASSARCLYLCLRCCCCASLSFFLSFLLACSALLTTRCGFFLGRHGTGDQEVRGGRSVEPAAQDPGEEACPSMCIRYL